MDFSDGSGSRAGSGRWGEGAGATGVRPVSRRGLRESSAMEPTSAYSRHSTSGFGAAPATASRQPTAMAGFSMGERPVTQQGLSGLRTGTSRGYRTRHLQDRRYWEELLQERVRETRAEVARLHERADVAERRRSAARHYEKRVRELAAELTELQGRLSDYNTAIRIASGAASRQAVEAQARELEEANEKLKEEVEQVFLEKQRKDTQLRQLKEQIEKEQSTVAGLLSEMTPAQREDYGELAAAAGGLRGEVQRARSELDELQREHDELSRDIAGSQMKVHMVELYRRLASAEERRDALKHELTSRLQPQEEREKLLQQVREDNAAIASMDSNASSLKEQIRKVQELIEQAEQDLVEGQSERHQKYKELKKREETMEAFMSTYEDNLQREQEKIDKLEGDIVFALEHSSANIDLDLGEIDSLKQGDGYDGDSKSAEGLAREYERLRASLKKAEATRERLEKELQTLPEKCSAMEEELVKLSDLERLREEGAEQKKALESEVEQLKEKLAPTESAVLEAGRKLTALRESLEGNETYTRLINLEETLAQLESRKAVLEEDISSVVTKSDYEPVKKQALEHVQALNKHIIEELNSSKSY